MTMNKNNYSQDYFNKKSFPCEVMEGSFLTPFVEQLAGIQDCEQRVVRVVSDKPIKNMFWINSELDTFRREKYYYSDKLDSVSVATSSIHQTYHMKYNKQRILVGIQLLTTDKFGSSNHKWKIKNSKGDSEIVTVRYTGLKNVKLKYRIHIEGNLGYIRINFK